MTKQTQALNPLRKLEMEIEQSPSVRSAIMLAKDRWEKNYQIVTGKKDGAQRFESELLNYLDIVNEKPELRGADKFSHFAAVMKAAVTGLSFRSDGHLYPIAFKQGDKTVVKVQIGAHGKREMLRTMPEIKFVHEAQVVMAGDHFRYDKVNSRVVEHTSTEKSSTRNKIEDVFGAYVRLEWKDGRITDVYLTREELIRAKSKSKNQGDNSVWEQWPLEMCKKVCYHRAKKLHHRFPDGVVDFGGEAEGEEETQDATYTTVEAEPVMEAQPVEVEEVKEKPKRSVKKDPEPEQNDLL